MTDQDLQVAAKDKRLEEARKLLTDWMLLWIRGLEGPIEEIDQARTELKIRTDTFLTTPTNPDMVMVRRDYAEQILAVLEEGTIEYDRLKAALDK